LLSQILYPSSSTTEQLWDGCHFSLDQVHHREALIPPTFSMSLSPVGSLWNRDQGWAKPCHEWYTDAFWKRTTCSKEQEPLKKMFPDERACKKIREEECLCKEMGHTLGALDNTARHHIISILMPSLSGQASDAIIPIWEGR
jgi:hypothetical protein